MSRDDFSKPTIDILAKRVRHQCSNPGCKQPTIGPNLNGKTTTIGTACHITGASPGGPRYEQRLSKEERGCIENGIWLCNNCAKLIDSDINNYPTRKLITWKKEAESEALALINGNEKEPLLPLDFIYQIIEADLIFNTSIRSPGTLSQKNNFEIENDVTIINPGIDYIRFWFLRWNYSFVIYNSSESAVYNIRIEIISELSLNFKSRLHKINNIKPLGNLSLETTTTARFEGTHKEADKYLHEQFLHQLNGLEIRINYLNATHKSACTLFKITNGTITNSN